MNLQFYLEKLHSSDKFKNFLKENPNPYFCSGFFIIDKENKKGSEGDKVHLDFYSPKKEKVFSFDIKEEIKLIPLENFDKEPKKISENCEFDFSEMEDLIMKEAEKKNIKTKIQRFIFSLQNHEGKKVLFGTAFLPMLSILKFEINLEKKIVETLEKKSLFDMIKIVKKGEE
jgi:hypothetical protein